MTEFWLEHDRKILQRQTNRQSINKKIYKTINNIRSARFGLMYLPHKKSKIGSKFLKKIVGRIKPWSTINFFANWADHKINANVFIVKLTFKKSKVLTVQTKT